MSFRPKDENELAKLTDDDLVAFLIEARDGGFDDQVTTATWMLIDRRRPQVVGLVRSKIRDGYDAEDVVQQVFEGALRASFRGNHTGEFFALLFTITRNKIADYFKAKAAEQENVAPNPEDSDPFDGYDDGEDFEAGVDLNLVVEAVLSRFSDRDQMVIVLKMRVYPSKEVAEIVSKSGVEDGEGMTPANCDQIYSRFRKKLRAALDEGGGDGP